MTKKTLPIALAVLFILPAICFAQEVEVGDIKFRWRKASGDTRWLLAQILVTNHTDERYFIGCTFQLLAKDGFELRSGELLWQEVEPGESEILHVDVSVSEEDYKDAPTLKLTIKAIAGRGAIVLERRTVGDIIRRKKLELAPIGRKPPLTTERTLTLPPWE